MWIRDFSGRKVSSYLDSGHKNVCFSFAHSLADTVSFMSLYASMKEKWPNVHFSISLKPEFNSLFGGISEIDETQFDYVFEIAYFGDLFSRHPKSKNKICCENELGIEYDEDLKYGDFVSGLKSPFVAVDFTSTINDSAMGCPREKAKMICEAIEKCGLIPVDVHFDSSDKIDEYYSYSFIPASFSKIINGNPKKLVSVLMGCCGYLGVIGDSFMVAKNLFETNCFSISNGVEPGVYLLPQTAHLGIDINDVGFVAKTEELMRNYLNSQDISEYDSVRGIVRRSYGDNVDMSKVKVKVIDNGHEEDVEIRPFSRTILKKNKTVYI